MNTGRPLPPSLAALAAAIVAIALLGAPVPAQPLPAQGVRALNGREYAPAVLELIEHAQSEVTLMLYQMRFYPEYPDSVTNNICVALADALDRGVAVRLLMDISDWKDAREGDENEKNRVFARVLVGHGATVHADPGDVISHQKVVVVDGTVSVVSSHNWSYYSTDKNYEAAVMIWSPEVAAGLNAVYEELVAVGSPFTESAPFPEVAQPIAPAAGGAPATNGAPTPATDAPADGEEQDAQDGMARRRPLAVYLGEMTWLPVESVEISPCREFLGEVSALIDGATTSIDIAQNSIEILKQVPPYARPDRPKDLPPSQVNLLVDDLVEAAGRGVAVRAALEWHDERDNSKNIVAATALMAAGATVFYDDPVNTLHAKMLVVDARYSVVGSTNWTFNAVEQGNEVSVIVDSAPLAAAMTGYMDEIVAAGRPAASVGNVPPLTQNY